MDDQRVSKEQQQVDDYWSRSRMEVVIDGVDRITRLQRWSRALQLAVLVAMVALGYINPDFVRELAVLSLLVVVILELLPRDRQYEHAEKHEAVRDGTADSANGEDSRRAA